jgi:hypothetical protein
MLKVIRRIFSFSDWSVSHPNQPPPGDMLDAQFTEIIDRVDVWEDRIRSVVTEDGKVAHGAITEHSLTPGLAKQLEDDIALKIQPAMDALGVAMSLAAQLKVQIARDADRAASAAQLTVANVVELHDRRAIALDDVNAALSQARELIASAQSAQDGWTNAQKDAFAGEQTAQNWAVASMDWAEYMPGPLPSDIIAMMGITGDHWSSRWWANYTAQLATGVDADAARAEIAKDTAIAEAAAAEAAKDAAMAADNNAAESAAGAEAAKIAAEAARDVAVTAKDATVAAADAAADLYDQFDDRYLGAKEAPPTTDNDGDPLLEGALYWNSIVKRTEVWTGSAWQAVGSGSGGAGGAAIDVTFGPSGTLSSTNVQAALQEVDGDVQALDARLDPVEAAVVSLDSRADALEATDVTLDARLDALETGATGAGGFDQRLDAIEADLAVPPAWTEITGKPATFPPSSHGHPQSEITNLVSDLAGKAPTVHTHTTAQVTGLDTALAAKAPLASPALTGIPTTPSPAANDNSTQIATTNFVVAATTTGGYPTQAAIVDADALFGNQSGTGKAKWLWSTLKEAARVFIVGFANVFTVRQEFSGGSDANAIAASNSTMGQIKIFNSVAGGAARLGFSTAGFGGFFGIDSDSVWKVGGWSMGAAAYKLLHEGLSADFNVNNSFITQQEANVPSTANFTPPITVKGNMMYVQPVAGSAFTFNAPAATPSKAFTMIVMVWNPGAIPSFTFAGFNKVSGDSPAISSGGLTVCYITRIIGQTTVFVDKIIGTSLLREEIADALEDADIVGTHPELPEPETPPGVDNTLPGYEPPVEDRKPRRGKTAPPVQDRRKRK